MPSSRTSRSVPCPWVKGGVMQERRRQRRRWRRLTKPERDLLLTAAELGVALDVKKLQRAASWRSLGIDPPATGADRSGGVDLTAHRAGPRRANDRAHGNQEQES